MQASPSLIEIYNMEKHYIKNKLYNTSVLRVVDGISLSISKGETFSLIGESGCGKSTLGRIIGKLLIPTTGKVLFEGRDITKLVRKKDKKSQKDIQYVDKEARFKGNKRYTVFKMLEKVLETHEMCSNTNGHCLISHLLNSMGLAHIAYYPLQELTPGERQLVNIACALILQPKLLILDDPLSGLDLSVQSQVLNTLSHLKKKRAITYLFISDNLNASYYISDQVAVMYKGRIVEKGTVSQIYEEPIHPYTQALMSTVPSIYKRERIVLKGAPPSLSCPSNGCPFYKRCPFAQEACKSRQPLLREIRSGQFVSCHLYA
ncbi:ABC transporter ATP-binding protein [Priestia filamentosa]|uniref:oligopeptide/dipeptide ABC transporter ATP-binding protein n=1 Tax=Priestia filamentosa TaxID=1402861 RepID=UPI00397C08A0